MLLNICSQVKYSSENEAWNSFFENGSGRIDVAVQDTIDARKNSVYFERESVLRVESVSLKFINNQM